MKRNSSQGSLLRLHNVRRRDLFASAAARRNQSKDEVKQQVRATSYKVASSEPLRREDYPDMSKKLHLSDTSNPDQIWTRYKLELTQERVDKLHASVKQDSVEAGDALLGHNEHRERKAEELLKQKLKLTHAQEIKKTHDKRAMLGLIKSDVSEFDEKMGRFREESHRRQESRMFHDRYQNNLKFRPGSASSSLMLTSKPITLQSRPQSAAAPRSLGLSQSSALLFRAHVEQEQNNAHFKRAAWSSNAGPYDSSRRDWDNVDAPVTVKKVVRKKKEVKGKGRKKAVKEPRPTPQEALYRIKHSRSTPILNTNSMADEQEEVDPNMHVSQSLSPYAVTTGELGKSYSAAILETVQSPMDDGDSTGKRSMRRPQSAYPLRRRDEVESDESEEDEVAPSGGGWSFSHTRKKKEEEAPKKTTLRYDRSAKSLSNTQMQRVSSANHMRSTHQRQVLTRPASAHVTRSELLSDCAALKAKLGYHNIEVSSKQLERALVTPSSLDLALTPGFEKEESRYPRPLSGLVRHPHGTRREKVKSKAKKKSKKKKGGAAAKKKRPQSAAVLRRPTAQLVKDEHGNRPAVKEALGKLSRTETKKKSGLNKKQNWFFMPVKTEADVVFPVTFKSMAEEKRQEAFEADWLQMSIADIVPSMEERESHIPIFVKFYPFLVHVFRTYALETEGRFFIGIMQFIQFVKTARIIDSKVSVAAVDAIFQKANMSGDNFQQNAEKPTLTNSLHIAHDSFNPINMLTFPEFCESLVRLAHAKFTRRKEYNDVPPKERLFALIVEFIMANTAPTDSSDIMQRMLEQDVVAWYKDKGKQLYDLFMSYAVLDDTARNEEDYSEAQQTLTVKEFSLMLKSKKMLGPKLSSRNAMMIFLYSQDDNDDSGSVETTFFEFLEVIARLAEHMAPDTHAPFASKLKDLGELLFVEV